MAQNSMAVKIDISNAYDKLEWTFLETMIKRLGFDDRCITKIMTYVTLVSYAILVNGQPSDKIVPTRGLYQGDLISPYLYLICVEGLSTLIHNTERASKI